MQALLFDSCKGYIQALANRPFARQEKALPSITISRETGSGAVAIAGLALEILQNNGRGVIPWTLFDRNIIEKVIEDHDLPQRIKQFMPEDKMWGVNSIMEEILGLHPNEWTLAEHTTETILRLASLGHAIIIGRGAGIITARLPNVLRVRLVAPLESRIRRMQMAGNLTEQEAALHVSSSDRGRKRYVKHYFKKDAGDPLNYHMVLNTGLFTDEQAAQLIAQAALDFME